MYEVKSQISNLKSQNQNAKLKIGEEGGGQDGRSNVEAYNSKFEIRNSKFSNLSPAQKFRLERQQAFALRSGAVGETTGKMLRIISVWRYPGTSPERDPIPAEILEELRDMVR